MKLKVIENSDAETFAKEVEDFCNQLDVTSTKITYVSTYQGEAADCLLTAFIEYREAGT